MSNVQGGVDDCKTYYVGRGQLEELLGLVNRVLDSAKLVKGKVANGYTFKDGTKEFNYEDGKVIKDSGLAAELLPTTSGFFFGGTDYDQYYLDDLKSTKKMLEEALASKGDGDFEYSSSW